MNIDDIKREIAGLKQDGSTTYENCEMLVTLCEALRYLDPGAYAKDYGGGYSNAMPPSRPVEQKMSAAPQSGGHLTQEMAQEWVSHMKNEDGTTGAHWTMEHTERIREKQGLDCDSLEFWVALNATYSDLCEIFRKHNINNIGAYTDFAVAFWLKDADAVEDKLAAYYCDVVEH